MDDLFAMGSPGESDSEEMEEKSDDEIAQLAEDENEEEQEMDDDAEDEEDEEMAEEDGDDGDDDEDEDEDADGEAEEDDEDEEDAMDLEKALEEAADDEEDAEGEDDDDDEEMGEMEAELRRAMNGADSSSPEDEGPSRPASPERQRRALFVTPSVPHRSYAIDPICALPHPERTNTHCLASSLCLTHLLTGSDDGYIRDYDFYASCNGESLLTSLQKSYCGLGEGITKGPVMRSWWTNASDAPEHQPLPVFSMISQMDSLWGLSGTSNGSVNLFTIRHDPGRIHYVFRGHHGPVSCMAMGTDETSFYSGAWDGQCHHWDLNTGQIIRTFERQYGSQMVSIALRPMGFTGMSSPGSSPFEPPVSATTQSSQPQANGIAALTPEPDETARTNGVPNGTYPASAPVGQDRRLGPSAPANGNAENEDDYDPLFDDDPDTPEPTQETASSQHPPPVNGAAHAIPPQIPSQARAHVPMPNGRTYANSDGSDDEGTDLPAVQWNVRATNHMPNYQTHSSAIPAVTPATYSSFSPNVLMTASIDGQVLLWDTRVQNKIGRLEMHERTPRWCVSACWSANGDQLYAGRRNQSIDIWDFRVMGRRYNGSPRVLRTLRNPDDSGPVTCVAAFPDGAHLVCASKDNIRLWNVETAFERDGSLRAGRAGVPFKIIAGHHDGVISQILIDATSKFMITASGDRGWGLGDASRTVLIHEVSPIR